MRAKRRTIFLIIGIILLAMVLYSCMMEAGTGDSQPEQTNAGGTNDVFDYSTVPPYSGDAYTAIHDNVPFFRSTEIADVSFEEYSEPDVFNRCGAVWACVGQELMPEEERGSIGAVKPTGWQTVRYDGVVDGNYLYNRCHLIGFQLTGENANERNLITGTRYLNIEGMLPFENMVADYVRETGNHVMYRATPVFEGDHMLASGVLLEGYSVEDEGEGICFCVFAYNVQPGIEIDYATGDSRLADVMQEQGTQTAGYVGNQNSQVFHDAGCSGLPSEENRVYFVSREEAVAAGYKPCGRCDP